MNPEQSREQQTINEDNWDLVIKPKTGLFDLHLADVWRYRDLLVLFIKRDFVSQYKQTLLGPVWHVIQPILTTLMFVLIFGNIARISTGPIHPVLFYLSGITIWNYFSACLTSTSNTFVSNAAIFGKVYFPRLVIPMAVVSANIVRFGIQFGLLVVAIIFYHFRGYPAQFNFTWLLIPVLAIMMAGIGLGLGIVISSITTKYRDFTVLLGFGIQLLMYGTPIVYPMSYVETTKYKALILMNPLTGIVEAFRYALFQTGKFYGAELVYSFVFMLVILFIGILLFNKAEKSFMDTV